MHICRREVLWAAWRQVRANHGAPGIDAVTIEQLEASEEGVKAFLTDIEEQLRTRSYRPAPCGGCTS